jgi:hypothetical protein
VSDHHPAHPPLDRRGRYRDNSPDALFGAIIAMETILGSLLAQAALQADQAPPLAALRREVEAALEAGQSSTKFGTGSGEIADGARDCLNAIAAAAARTVARSAPSAAVNAP